MNRLIGDLNDMTSIDSGKFSMKFSRQDSSLLITEAVHLFQTLAKKKHIAIEVEGQADSVLVDCDHRRILQVLGNLISNSIKFTPSGGTITLRREIRDGKVLFSVSDTGTGIPKSKLKEVFERFAQIERKKHQGL